MKAKQVAGVIGAAVIVAGAAFFLGNVTTTDRERTDAVQVCITSGIRDGKFYNCVTDAMQDYGVTPPPTPPPPPCEGLSVPAGADLSQSAAGAPAGTTFCLQEGTYPVPNGVTLQDGDRIVGVSALQTFIKGTGAKNILLGTSGAHIWVKDVDISGAVGDSACLPGCGRAIAATGQLWTIEDISCHDNVNQCVGAVAHDVTWEGGSCFGNGNTGPTQPGSVRSAACLKAAGNGDGVVQITDVACTSSGWNCWWADYWHGTFTVTGGECAGAYAACFHFEISGGFDATNDLTVTGVNIHDNGYGDPLALRRTGIQCKGCANLEVSLNTFSKNASSAVNITEDTRAPWGNVFDVSIHDNEGAQPIVGCSLSGVTCA